MAPAPLILPTALAGMNAPAALFAAASILPSNSCPFGYGAFFVVVQNLLNDAIIFASIFVVLLIAYAGFLFVTNPSSPSNVSKGRTVLIDAVIGFVIVIAAWLIVNEFVSVLTTGSLSSLTALLQPPSNNICL